MGSCKSLIKKFLKVLKVGIKNKIFIRKTIKEINIFPNYPKLSFPIFKIIILLILFRKVNCTKKNKK